MIRPWVVAAASAAIVILCASTVPLFVYSDQAYQLKAAQQTLSGETPLANAIALADPTDLTVTTPIWIAHWPPGPQIAAFPLMRAGLPLGVAVRLDAAAALLLGAIAWLRWWSAYGLPRRWLFVAALLLPWERYASNGVFQYSAEALAFGTIPWVLLATRRLSRYTDERPHLDVAFMVGLAAGALYWVKYSAVFVSAGCAVFLFLAGRASRPRRTEGFCFLAGLALPIAVLSIANHNLGGAANAVTASLEPSLDPRTLFYLLGNAGNMVADADSMLMHVFTDTAQSTSVTSITVALLGLPAGATLVWLLAGARTLEERMAAVVMGVSAVLLLTVWFLSHVASFEARHLAGAAIASLPAAIAVARRRWATMATPLRTWLLAMAALFVGLPWLYGPASVAIKVVRAHDYQTTNTRLYNPLAASQNLPAAIAAFRDRCRTAPAPSVWYVPEPLTALELSGAMLITHADFESSELLASRQYHGGASVCALLPRTFDANGKGQVIRMSFADIAAWQRVPIEPALYDLWIGSARQP